jgi:hypothetical protein
VNDATGDLEDEIVDRREHVSCGCQPISPNEFGGVESETLLQAPTPL